MTIQEGIERLAEINCARNGLILFKILLNQVIHL